MAGKVITPRQLAQQWLRLPNKFEVNVFNFEILVGNAAKKIFRDSFYLRRFNSSGTFSWQSRRDHKPHPILEETGALKHSIIWERFHSNKNRGVKLFTDPDMFKFSNRQYGRNFCYAAIHNEGGKIAKPGSPASYIRQRQFIGYSTTVADKISSYSIRIFDGFPK